MNSPPFKPLTPSQQRVADLLSRGFEYDDIARHLGCDPSTVRNHVHAISLLLDNPDNLRPSRLVFLWAAFQRWERERAVAA